MTRTDRYVPSNQYLSRTEGAILDGSEPRHISDMFGIETPAKSAVQDHNPEQQSNRKKNLPDAAQVKIFKPLVTEPYVMDQTLNARKFSGKASNYDDNQCTQQAICKHLSVRAARVRRS